MKHNRKASLQKVIKSVHDHRMHRQLSTLAHTRRQELVTLVQDACKIDREEARQAVWNFFSGWESLLNGSGQDNRVVAHSA